MNKPIDLAMITPLILDNGIVCSGIHDGQVEHPPWVVLDMRFGPNGAFGIEMELSLN